MIPLNEPKQGNGLIVFSFVLKYLKRNIRTAKKSISGFLYISVDLLECLFSVMHIGHLLLISNAFSVIACSMLTHQQH